MGEIAHSQVNSCHVAYSVDGNLSRLALSEAQLNTIEGFVDHSKAQLLLPFLNYTIDLSSKKNVSPKFKRRRGEMKRKFQHELKILMTSCFGGKNGSFLSAVLVQKAAVI